MITRVIDRFSVEEVSNGALLQEDGIIIAIGDFETLKQRNPDVPIIGTGNEVMLPGFVNAHHHVGLTPVQLGSPDLPLELWWITKMVIRDLDLYLDTLYSAFEMISSGVTTVQHLHGWAPGTLDEVEAKANQVIRAYEDVGMRASYSYSLRDQNRLMYQSDQSLIEGLPSELQERMRSWFGRFKMGLADNMELFVRLHEAHNAKPRIKIQLSPANLHWCSDAALTAFAEVSSKYGAPIHMHLVETAYQKAYASKRGSTTALDYLDRFGLLTPLMTLGHGVWLNEPDIDRIAEAGVCICHNCSSNFRLRSGIAPLNRFEARGINTAIGIDEAGINDDRDMLQEMRMVLRAHRVPGMNEADVPTIPQVLRMATIGGACTTPFGESIGTLAVGKAADVVLIDYDQVAYPYLDENTPLLDAVIQRAKACAVRATICNGEILYERGRFTRVDRDIILQRLHENLQKRFTAAELERRDISKAILPYIRAFYADYIDPMKHEPFYRVNSRV